MKKIIIPTQELKGTELFKFLVENKQALINQKKSIIKEFDGLSGYFPIEKTDKGVVTKAAFNEIPESASEVFVKVVGNAMNWCDSMFDVLLDNSGKRTIQQRKGMIPHLKNHEHKIESEIGDVQDIYLEPVSLKELGLKQEGATQCIIMESMVQRSYDEKVFNKYRKGKVKQHSIGIIYVEIYLAVNEPEDEYFEKEYRIWKKYYDTIINKEMVDEYGFFWAVKEFKLLEISGVLFGSNELTPTLETGTKEDHSPETGHKQPPTGESVDKSFDVGIAILTHKFF